MRGGTRANQEETDMTLANEIDLSRKIEWDPDYGLETLERDFDLAPGDGGQWFLWWRAERTWICSFPTQAVAEHVLIGDWDGVDGTPGWDRGDLAYGIGIDIVAALYRFRAQHGVFPQFKLDANSTMVEFLTRLGTDLGLKFLSNLVEYEGGDADDKPDVFHPIVLQHLTAGDYGLDASSIAPLVPQVAEMLVARDSTEIEKRLARTAAGRKFLAEVDKARML
jgi:hypothetical protein